MVIRRISPITNNSYSIDINITPDQVSDIINGNKPIQKVAPNLTIDEQEFLITGIPPTEWKEFFENKE